MIDLKFLNELEQFQKALKKNASQMNQGEQKSNRSGQGMIFKDHKEYIPGDSVKKIDWKAYARTKDYFIKRFEEERRLNIHILVDRSSSMDYGSPKKYEFAAKLGLGVAKMSLNTNDRYNFSVFSETLTNLSSGRRGKDITQLVEILNDLKHTPESRIEDSITEYSQRIENESAVVIISDFLSDSEDIASGLTSLKHTKPVVVNVLDEKELNPDLSGDKILKDPESSSRLRTFFSRKTKKKYRSRLDNHIDNLEEVSRKNGAGFIRVSTSEDILETLLKIWQKLNQK
ncbi:DUF58 domain-containing protein [Nanohaloarchaea archaeon]|jgi:uncharacterized protein (DUF58 family)|nr:DUF58 domain-containing protein [Candidatus Nanohaloarchaea archaeon]NMJ77311.1 DUF58 domain-containing protein [Candidatus Nanohaloarchaea archaeon]